MNKILVTGGLGFIGLHLCNRLLAEPDEVDMTIVDNLSSTRLDYSSLKGRARIVIEDFEHFDLAGHRYNEIYHLQARLDRWVSLETTGLSHSRSSIWR